MNRWTLIAYFIVSIFLTACTGQGLDSPILLDPSVQQRINQAYTLSDRSVLYFVDAHSQIDGLENSNFNYQLKNIPRTMARNNVRGTILSARGKRDSYDILELSGYHTGIYPSIRVKSGPYNSETYSNQILQKVKNKINKQLDQAASFVNVDFYAISESLIYHAAKYNRVGDEIAPRVLVPLSDNRAVYIRKRAKERGWPFVIHIEFRALRSDPISHGSFVPTMALPQTLADHRDVDFVLNHLGQLSATEVQDLIDDHDNIYFLAAHVTPSMDYPGTQWTIIFDQNSQGCVFKDEWKNLIERHSDRFIFALDNVWERHWAQKYDDQVSCWLSALKRIQPDTAHAIAHGNAERMWDLPH